MKSQSHNKFVSFLTFFAITGIAIGTMALLITLSILNGFEKKMTDNVSNFTSNIDIRDSNVYHFPAIRLYWTPFQRSKM